MSDHMIVLPQTWQKQIDNTNKICPHLPSIMVMMSLAWILSLSGSSKSCSALMSVGIVYKQIRKT